LKHFIKQKQCLFYIFLKWLILAGDDEDLRRISQTTTFHGEHCSQLLSRFRSSTSPENFSSEVQDARETLKENWYFFRKTE
jgi:hypothetical protein